MPAQRQPRSGREAKRPALERPPDPDDAATPAQERHINAERLRERLRELNPLIRLFRER